MEGSSGSIVSHFRNREQELFSQELSRKVKDLVQRLEGKGKPLTRLSNLDPEFREVWRNFFPTLFSRNETECASLSTIATRAGWQVRLRLLEAIVNCNTLEHLEVEKICEHDISKLTDREWKLVFSRFRSSTILREISIGGLVRVSDTKVESFCLQLGRILSTSSVTRLTVHDWRLSARCWLNLASGLRRNSDSKLKYLELRDAWEDLSAVKHVADMINSAPLLETLSLSEGYDMKMDEETVGIVSQALIHSTSLKKISLDDGKWGAALLVKALAGDDGNRSIERLHLGRLWRWNRLGDIIREILTSNPSLKEMTLEEFQMSPEKWHQLGEGIRDSAVEKFSYFTRSKVDWKSIEALVRAASSDVKDPKLELGFKIWEDHDGWMLSLNLLGRALRGEIKSLKSLSIFAGKSSTSGTNQDRMGSILSMNGKSGKTSVLKRLRLSFSDKDLLKEVWKDLLRCLRENTSLTHLDLSPPLYNWEFSEWPLLESKLDEEAFRDLMGLLQVNLTLEEIDVSGTSWETDGKAAQIQEALKQNEKRAVYMSVFKDAKLAFGDAKAGRLFLCGSPRAGKTQLRNTMMRINRRKNGVRTSSLFMKWKSLWRTKGIEVELLQNNDKMQISVWDLAGQWIFRTLQNVLFPKTNHFCVFLFVYSPFCEITSSNKPDSYFETELEDWLSFITSNTKVTGHDLPQVFVVISHKDKARCSSLTWAHSIVDKLTKRFANFVNLRPLQDCFHVDARDKKQVKPLRGYIFDSFDKLLSEKSPPAPLLCSQITSRLVKNTKENRSCPVWPYNKFYEFCAPTLREFIPSSSEQSVDHSSIMNSVISYLNDVGSIIYIPNLEFIIVDPNWLTNTFLGELIALGQHFHADDSKFANNTMSSEPYTSKDGFVSESVFAGLIEEFLAKQPHGQRGVDREVLENILVHLDLCFKLKDTFQYFIPSFIPEHASTEEQKHQEGAHVDSMYWETRDETSQFLGIRIQCEDESTMALTAAFFPCFQMFMRRKLISKKQVFKETVTCSRRYLRLCLDGYEIYVEQGTSHKYVDVLMLRSKHKSRSEALQYVMKHIIQELISFCASSKGCPGVALVLGVIQTRSVEKLISSHLRGAILIEELKSNYIRRIKDKLEDIPLDRLHLVKEEELFNYEHSWPLIEGHSPIIFEKARELLWESDVEAIENEIRQKRMQQLESWQQSLIQQLESLQQGLNEVNKDLIHSYPESENMVTNSNVPAVKDSIRPSSRCLSQESSSVEDRNFRTVLESIDRVEYKVDRVENKVDGVDERLRSVQSILQRLEMKILSLQQELQSTLSDFTSKVDRIVKYSHSLQLPSHPKRPYITDDVGVFHRITVVLNAGTTVRLHLMCESSTGFHKVRDQEGLKIRVDRYNSSWIGKTIEISYKVMYYAAKAGLDMTLGLGSAIPDLADLGSNISKLVGISDSDRRAVLKGGESMELKEAWLRIQQTLAPELRDSYSANFKLYQVKYVSLELGGHAWVCEECMHKGLISGILTV